MKAPALDRRVARCAALMAVAGAVIVACAAASAATAPAGRATDRATLRQLAEQGLQQTHTVWWDTHKGWFRGRSDEPVASMWTAFPLLELTAAVAIAHPTAANKQRVQTMFKQAEGYWDPTLANGAGGVAAGYKVRNAGHAFFDDAGWWGVAYLDAYRATKNTRWLFDARRALTFIDRFGWDKQAGGVWWDTSHEKKTAEPLAAATLIAATLYRYQHRKADLALARRYIAWADAKTRNPKQSNLYGRSDTDGTVMDYVQGMLIAAEVQLCAGTKQESWCSRAQALAHASLAQFPFLADWAPETDVVYLRGIVDLYRRDRDALWYRLLTENADRAVAHARDPQGLWSLRWDGSWTQPGTLYTQAATLELFAWTSALPPPLTS